MTEPAPGAAAEPVTETWTLRRHPRRQGRQEWHAWVDAAGEEHWFARTGSRMAVGSHYTAQETRAALWT